MLNVIITCFIMVFVNMATMISLNTLFQTHLEYFSPLHHGCLLWVFMVLDGIISRANS